MTVRFHDAVVPPARRVRAPYQGRAESETDARLHFYTASYEPLGADETIGRMESVNPIPFLATGLFISAVLGAISGFVAARRGWRLMRPTD